MSDIIQIKNVSKIYPGNVTAVDDLSLTVKEGEFVTFLGPSGCGKTTILRMIAGFDIPNSGKIYLAGEDVLHSIVTLHTECVTQRAVRAG